MIIAIDQSTGVASPLGVAIISDDKQILDTSSFWPRKKSAILEKRLIDLQEQLEVYLTPYLSFANDNKIKVNVCFEQFIMVGRQGESLAKAVGAYVVSFPNADSITFNSINNKQMKKAIGGTGAANKEEVAKGLFSLLPPSEHDYLLKLLNGQKYDELDAIGLAVTFIMRTKQK